MKYLFFLLFAILFYSCGYPDIDTVPEFKEIIITDKNQIDLCNLSNAINKSDDICDTLYEKLIIINRF